MNTWRLSKVWHGVFGKASRTTPPQKFVDLAPTATADGAGIYFEALDYATNNEDVLNIALTGPYGSGKSSVIKSFLARYPRLPLQLSLASFMPDGELPGLRVSKQEIERSILQQILYGVEANKLPFSRFKRIQAPRRRSIAQSFLITVGVGCILYLISKQADLVSGTFFKPFEFSNWFNYLCFAFAAVFAWKVVHAIYTTSFGLSLKSISLKDVQIAPAAANEGSILNRHLDEILYFFQSTEYDLVVIEDLDRFDNPDIFVTLREINGFINANEAIKRCVRFLYALRDDIFANTDRTKFFEFIVPIIPIINHSNSIDKILEQGRRIKLDSGLNRQFVREVSRYLTDLRLIRNIFNEYVVYAENLATHDDGLLDPNKLLAILIYKNVIPRDFAALHRQQGVLAQVLARYDQYISKVEQRIHEEISTLESGLELGEAQVLRDQAELRRLYAMAIIERIPEGYHVLRTANGNVSPKDLPQSVSLEQIISQKSVSVFSPYGSGQTLVKFHDLETSLDPTRSFAERSADLDRKSASFKQESEKRLRELKGQLASLRTKKFNEVVRESADLIDHVFAEVGEDKEILKYLILEGYLDDTYYQYISIFHKGRLSPSDNKFLIKIRAYSNPPPDTPIDNAAEVVASMRPEDFGHHYVLNRFIFDLLLADTAVNSRRIDDAVQFMAAHFEACAEFFRSYYARGTKVEELVQVLATRWSGFAAVALSGTDGGSHAARILAYMPDRPLYAEPTVGALSEFLSWNMREVLEEQVEFDLSRLRSLNVEIAEVDSVLAFPQALRFVAAEGLHRISIQNIRQILLHVVGWQHCDALERRHLSTLREADDAALLERIDSDFEMYVRDVLLALPTNTQEDLSVIADVLQREDVDYELRSEFLRRQTAVFPQLDGVPPTFHQVMLAARKVAATWENCIAFASSDAFDPELLTEYLQDRDTATILARRPIPGGEASLGFRQFVMGNDSLDLDVFRSYARQLPEPLDEFPAVDASKISILIEERKVEFTPSNIQELEDTDLRVLFVATNFAAYAADESQYTIDDNFRAKLLRTRIPEAAKQKLVDDIDEAYVVGSPSVAADVGLILNVSPVGKRDYGIEFIKAVISNSRAIGVQVSLLNKLNPNLSASDVRDVFRGLPEPFRDIATFGKSPRIQNNETNRSLVEWLVERKIVSSFNDTLAGDEIRIHTFRKET